MTFHFKKTMGKKTFITIILGSILLLGSSVPMQAASSIKDVQNHWAQQTIEQAVKDGYVTGYADKTFKPNAQVTRVEFAAILARVNDVEGVDAPASGFSDVPAWASSAVNQAVKLGYINKASYGSKLDPNTAMTRGEMAQWIANGLAKSHPEYAQAMDDLKNTLLPFTEYASFSQAQRQAFGLARGTGIITGLPDGSFGAVKNVSRAETVTMIYRYLAAKSQDPSAFKALNELREVGRTGTNIMTMGGKVGMGREFATIMETPLKTAYNKVDITVHKYIVIDAYKAQPTSVYTNMFIGAGSKPAKSFDGTDVFRAFVYATYVPLVARSNFDTYVQELSGITGLPLGFGVKGMVTAKGYNLPTFDPNYSYDKGTKLDVWTYTDVRPVGSNTVATKSGKSINFSIND